MQRFKFYVLPVVLVTLAVCLVVLGVRNKRAASDADVDKRCMDFAMRLVPDSGAQKKGITSADKIVIKQIVEGLGLNSGIEMSVIVDEKGVATMAAKASTEDEVLALLMNYEGIQNFLTSVQGLPYSMKMTNFCLGRGCQNGFTATIEFAK